MNKDEAQNLLNDLTKKIEEILLPYIYATEDMNQDWEQRIRE